MRGALDKDDQMMWQHTNALSSTVRKSKSCNAFFICGALVDSVGITSLVDSSQRTASCPSLT